MAQQLPTAARDALQFEEKKLPNGLTLRVMPMPEYGSVHAIYATGFGSIHRGFTQNDRTFWLPAGIAHFLEHKMFENEDGVDAFSLYAETGASANAYTGFDRTSYIFTATREVDRNLDILLSFVGHPHFTRETVAKEQGIIGQEILMYEDNADLRCVFALLECLYQKHPVRDDIVGTLESIAEITPELLYACCDAFYNPGNMALCAAGDITMEQLEATVARGGLPAKPAPPTTKRFADEPEDIEQAVKTFSMPVSMPLFGIGFKEKPVAGNTTKTEVVCDLLTELIAGEASPLYRRLYDEGLVQPSFEGEYGCVDGCLHFMFTGESDKPERVGAELMKEIDRQRREGIDEEQFLLCKRMMYGEAMADLESVERVASWLSSSHFRGRTPADELQAIVDVGVQDVQQALDTMLQETRSATVVVRPEGTKPAKG